LTNQRTVADSNLKKKLHL